MIRILPWITDGAVTFLDGFIGTFEKEKPKVFEFGIGNSSLYFLQRGCSVTGVDHDTEWAKKVRATSELFGLGKRLNISIAERPYYRSYTGNGYDIISIDGRDRVKCLEYVVNCEWKSGSILLLDNTERVWSGRYSEYIGLLQDFEIIHFEQPRIFGVSAQLANHLDRAGSNVGHRWVTTIAWRKGDRPRTTFGTHL